MKSSVNIMPERLSPSGNGEIQCVVFARDYNLARRALGKYNAAIIKSFPFISAYGVLINVYSIEDIKKLPCIREVCADSRVTVTELPRGIVPASGNMADVGILPELSAGMRGRKNKTVHLNPSAAFIDTGFSPPLDFYLPRKRLKAFVDFIDGREKTYDDNGHGTAVGCLIACDGRFTSKSREGTAAGADIISVKAIERDGSGSVFHILEGMQWVYDNAEKYHIGVLCMSLGGAAVAGRDPLCVAAEALWRTGVTVVASAGNSGEEGVTSPGSCGRIITVGSAEKNSEGRIVRSPFSSYSEDIGKPDVCADGSGVACVGVDGEKTVLSGTSISAPIVAGICLEIIKNNPYFTPDMVKRELLSRAVFLGEPGTGYGYIGSVADEKS